MNIPRTHFSILSTIDPFRILPPSSTSLCHPHALTSSLHTLHMSNFKKDNAYKAKEDVFVSATLSTSIATITSHPSPY